MKYVILIHANPEPWGHPTARFTREGRERPEAEHEAGDRAFEVLLNELVASGELLSGEALGDPARATTHRWSADGALATDGPYAEAKEQLAGFFLLKCASRERAEEIAAQFAGPGSAAELREVGAG